MERHTMALQVFPGKMDAFRSVLGTKWTDITALLDTFGVRNFSAWNAADLIFIYGETDDGFTLTEDYRKEKRRILDAAAGLFRWISEPEKNMRLMYHDFGRIRENKELIRHRVFMTKLKEGCEEEYKANHDGLIAARGNVVDPGPDSNFSIWYAGGFIFGYNEIDTTMEREETPGEHEATVAWETSQLELMDWITNDCDWLTGEIHTACHRLAWHRGE